MASDSGYLLTRQRPAAARRGAGPGLYRPRKRLGTLTLGERDRRPGGLTILAADHQEAAAGDRREGFGASSGETVVLVSMLC
jgi:hypothetical protein